MAEEVSHKKIKSVEKEMRILISMRVAWRAA
jgi:hypothetical protein